MLSISSDVTIIGGGPAGLQAGIYAASEGFSTVILEADRIGGQIRQTPRLENFAGQNENGVSGPHFARQMERQARKMGVLINRGFAHLRREGNDCHAVLSELNGRKTRIDSKVIVVATGATWRKLDVPGVKENRNRTFHYGPHHSINVKPGGSYVVIGGGNSSGQAIITLAQHAEKVYVLVRSGIGKMSAYLQQRIQAARNVQVIHGSTVAVHRDGVTAVIDGKATRIRADHTYFAGGQIPNSTAFRGVLDMDSDGFIKTGHQFSLQTSVHNVFAIGDVRSGVHRRSVGNAIADANTVTAEIFNYLSLKTEPISANAE